MAEQTEYPALLDVGFYLMSLEQVRELCVDPFPLSVSRPIFYNELLAAVERLDAAGVVGDVWINGSFLTAKPEPGDLDLLLYVRMVKGSVLTDSQKQALAWFALECGEGWGDIAVVYEQLVPIYAPRTRRFWADEWNRALWVRQFGFSRRREVKGIAVVSLPLSE